MNVIRWFVVTEFFTAAVLFGNSEPAHAQAPDACVLVSRLAIGHAYGIHAVGGMPGVNGGAVTSCSLAEDDDARFSRRPSLDANRRLGRRRNREDEPGSAWVRIGKHTESASARSCTRPMARALSCVSSEAGYYLQISVSGARQDPRDLRRSGPIDGYRASAERCRYVVICRPP